MWESTHGAWKKPQPPRAEGWGHHHSALPERLVVINWVIPIRYWVDFSENFCGGSSVQVGESCLYMVDGAQRQYYADDKCEDRGGRLATPSTLAQFRAYDLMRFRLGYSDRHFWTGLYKLSDVAILATDTGVSTEETVSLHLCYVSPVKFDIDQSFL